MDKLQLVRNFSARILTGKRKFDHITRSLNNLGWLNVKDTLLYQDAIMMFKSINGMVPSYLSSKLIKRNSEIHNCVTRQANDLNILRCTTKTATRSFVYPASQLWNSFDTYVRNLNLGNFKKNAKEELLRNRNKK